MKASELRIGNYVYAGRRELILVESIIHTGINLKCILDSDYGTNINEDEHNAEMIQSYLNFELTPIPLTEEWLLRFGFHKVEKNFKYKNIIIKFKDQTKHNSKYVVLWIYQEINGYFRKGNYIRFWYGPQHVHQLQNLFFALTGKELEVKEPTTIPST